MCVFKYYTIKVKKNYNFNLAMISMLDGASFKFDTVSAVLVFLIFFLLYLIATAGLSPYAHFIAGSGPAGIPNSGGPNDNRGRGGGTPLPGPKDLAFWLTLIFGGPLFVLKTRLTILLFLGFSVSGSIYLFHQHIAKIETLIAIKAAFEGCTQMQIFRNLEIISQRIDMTQVTNSYQDLERVRMER